MDASTPARSTGHPRTQVWGTRGLLGATLIAMTLTGCGQSGSDSSETSSTRPSSSQTSSTQTSSTPGGGTATSSGTTTKEGDIRARLAAGLQGVSPANAALVLNPQAKLTVVKTPWLPGRQIIDVQVMTVPHPRRFYAALVDEGAAEVLTGQPARFNSAIAGAGVRVDSATVATQVAAVFLDSTRDFQQYSYRISGVDDVTWRPKLDADGQRARSALEKSFQDQVGPAAARRTGDGWEVTEWMVNGRELVRHQLTVAADGAVTDSADSVAQDLPVPASR